MLISHRYKFIYTKTAKTAGTSVEAYFEEYCMPEHEWTLSHGREEYVSSSGIIGYRGASPEGKTWYNHMSAAAILELAGRSVWENYFKFCVIRNPFEKAVSAFHFFKKTEDYGIVGKEFKEWIIQGGLQGLVDRDKYMINGEMCMDYFIRYESLDSDMSTVCSALGLEYDTAKMPEFKKGIRPHDIPITQYYDNYSIERVKEVFAFELDKFGYKFPVID